MVHWSSAIIFELSVGGSRHIIMGVGVVLLFEQSQKLRMRIYVRARALSLTANLIKI